MFADASTVRRDWRLVKDHSRRTSLVSIHPDPEFDRRFFQMNECIRELTGSVAIGTVDIGDFLENLPVEIRKAFYLSTQSMRKVVLDSTLD